VLTTWKFAHKIWLLPGAALAALGVVLWTTAVFGGHTTRALWEIEQRHYPALELQHSLQTSLKTVQRALQDAVAASDVEELRTADSLASLFREASTARSTPLLRGPELTALRSQFDGYYDLSA